LGKKVVLGVPLVGMALGQLAVLINIYFWEARYKKKKMALCSPVAKMSPLDVRQCPSILDCAGGEGVDGTMMVWDR
jgi:hypothetical protein